MLEQEIREGIQKKYVLEKELPYDSKRAQNLKEGEYMLREISKNYEDNSTHLVYTAWFGELSRRWIGDRSNGFWDSYEIFSEYQTDSEGVYKPSLLNPTSACYWSEAESGGEPKLMWVRLMETYFPHNNYINVLDYLIRHPGEKVITEYCFGHEGKPMTHVEFSYNEDTKMVKCSKYDYFRKKIVASRDLPSDMVKYGMFDFLEDC